MKNRFGQYFEGFMGAEAIKRRLRDFDLAAESERLREIIQTGKGQRKTRALKRLKVVSAFLNTTNSPIGMVLDAVPVIPPGPAPDGAAGRRSFRDLRPQRPVPPRHQPQQPPQAACSTSARPRSS